MEPLLGKADLHIHSRYSSDAFSSVRDILCEADKKGLDVIAITDHDTVKSFEEVLKIAGEFKVKAVMGQEISSKKRHILGIFIKKEILGKMSALETVREIHAQGGLAIIPHPTNKIPMGISLKELEGIYKEADGIEAFNSSPLGWFMTEKINKINSEVFHLSPIGGSDAHILRQIGLGYTAFIGKTPEDLYSSIKNKTTQAGRMPDLFANFELILRQPERFIRRIFFKK
jgi:predicted metal-dependent phosphoesterase TrpH